jgi:hypothetical protein
MDRQSVVLLGVSVGTGAVGFFVGYKVAERRLSDQFDERLEKETKGMREFYTAAKKPYATPQEAVADLIIEKGNEALAADKTAYHKIVQTEGYTSSDGDKAETVVDFGEQPVVVANIFSKNERDPEIPYVISQEEFMQNERDWEQITLTYYDKDNVLTDNREDVIEDPERVLGPEAIKNFGLQSSDPNVVHICNEKLGLMFEVVRHQGSYAQEVLGLDAAAPDLPSGRARSDT